MILTQNTPTMVDNYETYKFVLANFPKQLNISNNDKIEITFNSNPEMNININLPHNNNIFELSYLETELSKWFLIKILKDSSLSYEIQNSEHNAIIRFP